MNRDDSRWEPEEIKTNWKKSFVFTSKTSLTGNTIKPLSKVYKRHREIYSNGRSLEFIDYYTPAEYIMALLKDKQNV